MWRRRLSKDSRKRVALVAQLSIRMRSCSLLLLSLSLAACSLLASGSPAVVIQVTVNTGPDAGSLQDYLCRDDGSLSDTTLMLGPGGHSLEEGVSCVVSDVQNLAIVGVGVGEGEGEVASSVVCNPQLVIGNNFIFLNITNLTIQNVGVAGCGRVLPEGLPPYVNNTVFYIDQLQKAVFVFAQVTHLRLLDFAVTHSYGYSVIGINLRGDAEMSRISITDTNNTRHPLCHGNETDLSCAGGGAVFLYSDPIEEEGEEFEFEPLPTTLTVSDSSIERNENDVPTNRFIPVFLSFRGSFTLNRLLLTGATGLGVYWGQRSYDVDVRIVSSVISDNVGYASALAFLLFNTIRNVRIKVEGCVLERNEGFGLARGGGMLVLVITYVSELDSFVGFPPEDIHSLLQVRNTTFVENFADIGGAGYFFFAPQNITDYSITFDNVTFDRNRARIGTAFEADTRPATFVQSSVHFLLQDVSASGNGPTTMFSALTNSDNSAAFVFLSILNITVSGRGDGGGGSSFTDNSPGAFLIVGGQLYLQGVVQFANNTGLRGGAISMYDYALVFIMEGSRVSFLYNSALQVGGAFYADSPATGNAPTCVFQVIGSHRVFSVASLDQLDISLLFVGNTAVDGGNSVYVNPLYGCATLPESSLVDLSVVFDSIQLYSALFTFQSPVMNNLSEISSLAQHVCMCSPGQLLTPQLLCMESRGLNITIVPGQHFTLQLFPADLMFHPVSSILFITLTSDAPHRLGRGQQSAQLNGGKCTTVDFDLYGPEASEVSMFLHTQQGTSLLQVNVVMESCPLGFIPVTQDGDIRCVCDPFLAEVGSSCNATTRTVSRRTSSWLGGIPGGGVNSSSEVVVAYIQTCPIGFCNSTYESVDLEVVDQLCLPGRTGVLCGGCKGNLSVVFGSAQCMECSSYWLFSIVGYAIAGVAVVLILFFLDYTVTQGSLIGTGVIFYVNIVSVNSNILFQSNNRGFLFIWVSLLNLELGFPLCFYDGMSEAAKAGLQCIFPVYLLSIVLVIIVLSRYSRVVAKEMSSHSIHVLATLIYLSFSKMLRYVIDIMSYGTLRSEGGVAEGGGTRKDVVWWFDGNIPYFTQAHIIIVIFPAMATLFFIILYTASLLFIRPIEKCTSRFKPLLDAYGGPYKDRYRFWFGLRLVVLIVICLTYALLGTDDPVLAVLIQQAFLVIFMILQAFLRPLRSLRASALDLFYMLDMFFLFLYTTRFFEVTMEEQKRAVNSLVALAFAMFVLLMSYHVYRIPVIHRRLGPKVGKLAGITWSWEGVKKAWCWCRRKSAQEKPAEVDSGGSGGGGVQLSAVKHVSDSFLGTNDSGIGNIGRGVSTTEVFLDTSDDMDRMRLSRVATFSKWRESIIDD